MTDQAIISSLVPFVGQSVAGSVRSRTETDAVPEPRQAGRPAAPAKGAEPITGSRTPLLAGQSQIAAQEGSEPVEEKPDGSLPDASQQGPQATEELTEEEKKKVQELQRRDREVRAHEAAHKTAGGSLAGHPTFETVKGPDGRSYAVSGEVKIDTSEFPNNPDATIRKMETVKRAALAPSNPSGQDRQVAAEAESKIQKARQEKREEQAEALEKANGAGEDAAGGIPSSGRNALDPASANPVTPAQPGGKRDGNTPNPGTLFNLVA